MLKLFRSKKIVALVSRKWKTSVNITAVRKGTVKR